MADHFASNQVIGPCSECKWWRQNEDWQPGGTDWGRCEMAQGSNYLDPLHPETKAHAAGAGCSKPRLRCRRDFGCVQWEAKE